MIAKAKDRLYIYKPFKGIDELVFNDNEEQLVSKIGLPVSKEKILYDDESYSILMNFSHIKLSIFQDFENDIFEKVTFHPKKLIIDDIEVIDAIHYY